MHLCVGLIFSLLAISMSSAADDLENPGVVTETCPALDTELPLATEYGSAGIMKNLAESPDSIRAIAARLLDAALTTEIGINESGCAGNCAVRPQSDVVYRVAPVAFLATEKQNQICLSFEDQTSRFPMRFKNRSFDSIQAVTEWITDFSQGRGDDGKHLYEQCSSNCSPRYTFNISKRREGYRVDADVLCGLARDRDNDQYLISTSLRRICPNG